MPEADKGKPIKSGAAYAENYKNKPIFSTKEHMPKKTYLRGRGHDRDMKRSGEVNLAINSALALKVTAA